MAKYIDQETLCEFARHSKVGVDANDIMRLPTIRVVNCEDCKYWHCLTNNVGKCILNIMNPAFGTDFCSYGLVNEAPYNNDMVGTPPADCEGW